MSKIAWCNKGEDYNVWVCQSMESLNQWGTSKTKKGMKSPLESLFLIGMRIFKKLFSARIIEITHSQYFSLQVSQTCQMFLIGCLHLRSHSLCADKVHYLLHYRLDAFLHLVQHVRLEAVIVICDITVSSWMLCFGVQSCVQSAFLLSIITLREIYTEYLIFDHHFISHDFQKASSCVTSNIKRWNLSRCGFWSTHSSCSCRFVYRFNLILPVTWTIALQVFEEAEFASQSL